MRGHAAALCGYSCGHRPRSLKLAGYRNPPPVGHGRQGCRVLSVSYVSDLCFMFQVFHLNVAKVDMECCICCNGNICMLQAYVLIVSCVSDVYFKMFHRNVSKVDLVLHMLQ